MNWISVTDISNIKKHYPYLLYGDQLKSHFPGKDIACWDGQYWYAFDDEEYLYRSNEIDFYMDIMEIPNPTREFIQAVKGR